MGAVFDLAEALVQVATVLTEAGVRSASADPSEVLTPGVWVQARSFQPVTLDGGYDVQVTLLLITDENGHMRAVTALSDLYTQVSGVFPPSGPVTPALAALDDDQNLPALSVPVRVRWNPTPDQVFD